MPKSKKVHLSVKVRGKASSACGADRGENSATEVELTTDRKRVTCSNCQRSRASLDTLHKPNRRRK